MDEGSAAPTRVRSAGTRLQAVVVNDEEQYSIWPAERELPAGWRTEGFTGTEDECLAYIDETWTDMRPASLRRFMRGIQGSSPGPAPHDDEQAGAD
ncbi:MAG TPA: MbtH family NRPS accessory protein [Streptosporangiaceae bacterium]|nr:MbtH family NRPS accessory protein [Streptosporangiaceae bacterium]